MTRLLRPILSCAMGALLMAGCESALSPGDVAGRFVLESVAADPLPAVILQSGPTTITVLSDTLELGNDETGSEVRVQRVDPGATITPVQNPVHYEIHGDSIALSRLCPINAICLAVVPPVLPGKLTATGLVLQDQGGEYVYRRID